MTLSEPQTWGGGGSVHMGVQKPMQIPPTQKAGVRWGAHRTSGNALTAEVTDTWPIIGILIPDAPTLAAQLWLTLAVLPRARASGATLSCREGLVTTGRQRVPGSPPTSRQPPHTLLTGPCPDLFNMHLLLARGLPQLTRAGVGDTIAATYRARRRPLTPRAHTLTCQAHCAKGAHCVPAALCRGSS